MLKHRIVTLDEAPNGLIRSVNKRKLYEFPFYLTPTAPNTAITVPANQSSAIIVCPVSGEGPAQIETLGIQSTGVAAARLGVLDGEAQRFISNRAIHISTIFGNGQRAYTLPEALYIDESRSLFVVFSDLSGAENVIRPAFGAARYTKPVNDPSLEKIRARMAYRQYMSAPYFYTLDSQFITLTALGTGTATISIGMDHGFEVHKITGISTGRYTFQITDISTGEPLFDGFGGQAVQMENTLVVGSPGFPFTLAEKRYWSPGTKLQVDFTDLSNAGNTINLTLSGRMIANRMWRN